MLEYCTLEDKKNATPHPTYRISKKVLRGSRAEPPAKDSDARKRGTPSRGTRPSKVQQIPTLEYLVYVIVGMPCDLGEIAGGSP